MCAKARFLGPKSAPCFPRNRGNKVPSHTTFLAEPKAGNPRNSFEEIGGNEVVHMNVIVTELKLIVLFDPISQLLLSQVVSFHEFVRPLLIADENVS